MAKQPKNLTDPTALQMVFIVLGALVALTIVSLGLVYFLNDLKDFTSEADKATDAAAVTERIEPVAEVEVAKAETAANGEINGEQIAKNSCAACHATGALSAPKIGDKAGWGPRIAQGYETLVKNAINGIRMMPARGGNPDLSDAEIAHAVAFMANSAGAKFTPPEADSQ